MLLFSPEGGRGVGSVFRHQIQKPELVSGFFTSAVCASSGGTSRICLASVTPRIPPVLALRGLSVLRFSLVVSRACARLLPVLARVSWRLVVLVKWLPPATEEWKRGKSSAATIWQPPASSGRRSRGCSTLKFTGWANSPGRPERPHAHCRRTRPTRDIHGLCSRKASF